MYKKLSILIFSLLVFSCNPFPESLPNDWKWGVRPRPLTSVGGFPSAKTDYGKGFKDGCAIGWKATLHGPAGDIKAGFDAVMLVKNSDYANGFDDGYNHCVNSVDWDVP